MFADALPFCILALDAALEITEANLYAESVFGLGPDDLQGAKLSRVIHKNDVLFGLLRDTLTHGVVMKAYDHEIHLADGRSLRAHLHASPIWNVTQEISSVPTPVGAYLALDPLLGAERIGKQLAQRDIARRAGLMAAMLAHEVKNPLSGIRGAAQLLQDELSGSGNEELDHMTALIMKEVDRISATLGRVEFLTHSEPAAHSPVNIHEALHYARSVLDPGVARRIRFREQFDPSIPEAAGDRELLIQLFLNLLKNAAEAVMEEEQPAITLSTYYRHDFRLRMKGRIPLPIVVSVADNGPGVPGAMHETLFDPYVTTKKGGNGLGLAIASKIAAEHGGMIELTGSLPGNTIFSVMLPAVRG